MSQQPASAPRAGLSATARREHIMIELERTGFISARELTLELGVSDMTIRRDLRRLEGEGSLRMVHGGASLPIGGDYQVRGMSEQSAKAEIGRFAVTLVPPGAALLLDAGTTVTEAARALPPEFDGYVITHSVPVIEALMDRPEIPVHCLGGELRTQSRAMIGPTTVENLAHISAQVLFLGAAAVNERGVFVAKDLERTTKTAFIASAQRVILLVDHTKFSRFSPILLAPLSVIDEIVTDKPLPRELEQVVSELGIVVHVLAQMTAAG